MVLFASRASEWGAADHSGGRRGRRRSTMRRRRWRLTLQWRLDEQSVIEGHVQFDFFDRDFLLVGAALGVGLERIGLIPAADFLVVAEGGLEFALLAADESPGVDFDRQVVVGVHVVVEDVAA